MASSRPVSVAELAGVKRDWRWSDQFMDEVRGVLSRFTLVPAGLGVDRNEATDLVSRSGRIAVRIRRKEYVRYAHEFTLRAGRDSGSTAELDKIFDGYGDLMLYGFESETEPGRIGIWHLIDLKAFRGCLIRSPATIKTGTRSNADGTHLRWFDLRSFPPQPAILVASNHPELRKELKP